MKHWIITRGKTGYSVEQRNVDHQGNTVDSESHYCSNYEQALLMIAGLLNATESKGDNVVPFNPPRVAHDNKPTPPTGGSSA